MSRLSLPLPVAELLANTSRISYGVIYFLTVMAVLWVIRSSRDRKLDAIPTVGSSTWLGSWWAALKFVTSAQSIIQEGYEKYKSAPFKVAELHHWTVILSNRQSVEELARASKDDFTFLEAVDDLMHLRYTVGPEIIDNPYHTTVIRSHLTRSIPIIYPEIRDEIVTSFDEVLNLRADEWKSVPALSAMEKIICRTSNRAFVGLPLCRDPDWIDLNIRYTVDVIAGGAIAGLFPGFMRALATRFLTNIPRKVARGVKCLGSMIEERKKYLAEYGTKRDDEPNDLLSWLMELAVGPELTVELLTNRILFVNFAAIHTSSNAFTQALFRLASNAQYVTPLREEVERIVERDGWSKIALRKMRKVDSFLKECQRIEGIASVTILRKAVKDYTFADGTFIPKGTRIAAAALSLHHDARTYENPEAFEPFRFAGMPEEDGAKHQFASTSTEYLPFGHSRNACPGRFFVATMLKTMLAHIVVTYDLQLEDNAIYPASWHLSALIGANHRAKVMFRNRAD